MNPVATAAIVAAVVTALAACSSATSPSAAPASSVPAARTAAAKPLSCHQQYAAWKTGPAKAASARMVTDLGHIQAQASAEDIPGTRQALEAAGNDAAALRAWPVPACADPAGYWAQILTDIKSAGDNAGTATGVGGLILAMGPLQKVTLLEGKLAAEVKHATAAPKAG